jgi:uncharacterized protein
MSAFEDLSFSVEGFSGRARLFPLPNLVLFPHVMQPLHVFEPRYREMIEDALSDDRLIAMALLKPGWESQYEGRPPLYRHACLGRIATHHRLEDGTYNLLLLGVRRVRLLRELEPTRRYRTAEVAVCEDECPPDSAPARAALRKSLREVLARALPTLPEAREQLDQLLGGGISLGVLTDLVAYMLDIGLAEKAALLAEVNVQRRAETLLNVLRAVEPSADGRPGFEPFPPLFSSN